MMVLCLDRINEPKLVTSYNMFTNDSGPPYNNNIKNEDLINFSPTNTGTNNNLSGTLTQQTSTIGFHPAFNISTTTAFDNNIPSKHQQEEDISHRSLTVDEIYANKFHLQQYQQHQQFLQAQQEFSSVNNNSKRNLPNITSTPSPSSYLMNPTYPENRLNWQGISGTSSSSTFNSKFVENYHEVERRKALAAMSAGYSERLRHFNGGVGHDSSEAASSFSGNVSNDRYGIGGSMCSPPGYSPLDSGPLNPLKHEISPHSITSGIPTTSTNISPQNMASSSMASPNLIANICREGMNPYRNAGYYGYDSNYSLGAVQGRQKQIQEAAAFRHRSDNVPYSWITKKHCPPTPSTGKTRTKDKYRVVYSDHQRLELEKEFHYSRYITIRRKAELAQTLNLSERQVKIWFQNRRAKERKQNKKKEETQLLIRNQQKQQSQSSEIHSSSQSPTSSTSLKSERLDGVTAASINVSKYLKIETVPPSMPASNYNAPNIKPKNHTLHSTISPNKNEFTPKQNTLPPQQSLSNRLEIQSFKQHSSTDMMTNNTSSQAKLDDCSSTTLLSPIHAANGNQTQFITSVSNTTDYSRLLHGTMDNKPTAPRDGHMSPTSTTR